MHEVLEIIESVLRYLWGYKFDIVVLIFIFKHKEQLWDIPIKGENGIPETDEIAKVVLIWQSIILTWAHIRWAIDNGESIDPTIMLYIVGAVAALAGVTEIPKIIDARARKRNSGTEDKTDRRSRRRHQYPEMDQQQDEAIGEDEV